MWISHKTLIVTFCVSARKKYKQVFILNEDTKMIENHYASLLQNTRIDSATQKSLRELDLKPKLHRLRAVLHPRRAADRVAVRIGRVVGGRAVRLPC
mgnify:CR=1 FL=1